MKDFWVDFSCQRVIAENENEAIKKVEDKFKAEGLLPTISGVEACNDDEVEELFEYEEPDNPNKKAVQNEILALLDTIIEDELTALEGSTIAGVAREVLLQSRGIKL